MVGSSLKNSKEQLKKEQANKKALVKACDDVSSVVLLLLYTYLCMYVHTVWHLCLLAVASYILGIQYVRILTVYLW